MMGSWITWFAIKERILQRVHPMDGRAVEWLFCVSQLFVTLTTHVLEPSRHDYYRKLINTPTRLQESSSSPKTWMHPPRIDYRWELAQPSQEDLARVDKVLVTPRLQKSSSSPEIWSQIFGRLTELQDVNVFFGQSLKRNSPPSNRLPIGFCCA
jgi:hypothetical protein